MNNFSNKEVVLELTKLYIQSNSGKNFTPLQIAETYNEMAKMVKATLADLAEKCEKPEKESRRSDRDSKDRNSDRKFFKSANRNKS